MLVFILSLFHVFFYPEFNKPGLTVSLSNIKQAKGKVYVAVYDKQSVFLSMDKMIDRKIITVTTATNPDAKRCHKPAVQRVWSIT